jgi:protein-L-isoaspartate(D-aspartate) O-methyltransferase
MAALMASQCAHVTTIEIDPEIAEFARNNLKKNGVTCATVVNGCGLTLAASLGKFDVIVLSGATPVIPQQLLEALNPQGRLIAIAGKAPAMQLVFAAKSPDGKGWVNTFLLETEAKLLSNTPKINEFVF